MTMPTISPTDNCLLWFKGPLLAVAGLCEDDDEESVDVDVDVDVAEAYILANEVKDPVSAGAASPGLSAKAA